MGSLFEPLAVAYRSVEHAGELEGKTVLIVGAGTIGLLALACVKMKKAGKILISDLSCHRLRVAGEMGADAVIDPKSQDLKPESWKRQEARGWMLPLRPWVRGLGTAGHDCIAVWGPGCMDRQ